jgi:tetratricopeptide (TPR) repeat protein
MNKWARPFEWNDASPDAGRGYQAAPHQHYFAFLSYSHKDEADAHWLHSELERFRVPAALVGRLTENGPVPKRLTPIFRDRHELAAADDLGEEIREALNHSRCMIVLCSPAAAKSKWTNAEIDTFKRLNPDGCIIAAVIAGEPLASDIPGREDEECFPPALVAKYNRRGRPTGRKTEPLAADLREGKGGRRVGFLKVVAGILGVGLDELVQREQLRRQRRLAGITAGSFVGMLVAGGLAVTAIQARDAARDQRREAEGLVEFMVGDLREKLEPIGKLDALDGVGSRVLEYYSRQNTSELSDSALLQRSRALNLTAEVAYLRGDLDTAHRLYHEAMEGTAEAVRRDSSDPQRLFEHAQNVFWAADIARQRGQLVEAEAGMREYKRLADQMVMLAPDNMKWRMEQQSADFNLGIMLLERRSFAEAIEQLTRSRATMEALATADPSNTDYQVAVTESATWLADAQASLGRLSEATRTREQLVGFLQQLLNRTGDVVYRQKLVPAQRYLGELYQYQGDTGKALANFRAAVDNAEVLTVREPDNSRWRYFSARARLNLANMYLVAGQREQATEQTARGCDATARLLATDPTVQVWRANMRECLEVRARLGLAAGEPGQAAVMAERAVETARSIHSTDPVDDRYALAQSYRLLGDARRAGGNKSGANAAWNAALKVLPSRVAEKPSEMAERALLLQRIGRTEDAQLLMRTLARIGFKQANV